MDTIEVGAHYRTQGGRVVRILRVDDTYNDLFVGDDKKRYGISGTSWGDGVMDTLVEEVAAIDVDITIAEVFRRSQELIVLAKRAGIAMAVTIS